MKEDGAKKRQKMKCQKTPDTVFFFPNVTYDDVPTSRTHAVARRFMRRGKGKWLEKGGKTIIDMGHIEYS